MRLPPLLPASFYQRSVEAVARDLLGQRLVHGEVVLRIAEVEAYAGPGDSASHARHGRTARNAVMWGPGGHAYLYLCYGLHWMLNVSTGEPVEASAVLIRGAVVEHGLDVVLDRRSAMQPSKGLLSGPGKVGQALALDRSFDGSALFRAGGLELREGPPPERIEATPRVGIGFATKADQARPWRFLAR